MTNKELKYYNRINSAIIGRKIIDVFYEELDYETGSEYWKQSENIHSVDMNVIFRLDNRKIVQIKWDNEFHCYGIGFEKLNGVNIREGIKTIKLTENKTWKKLIGKEITEISVLWDINEGARTVVDNKWIFGFTKTENVEVKLPQTWQIEFENDNIWISALEIKENGSFSYGADHLTILFSNKEQEKFKLIEKASSQQSITSITAD